MNINRKQTPKLVGYMALILLLTLVSGCTAYMNPGPDPARLTVSVQASLDKERVAQLKYHTRRNARGPLWVWNLYVVQGDGYYQELKPQGPGPARWIGGYRLDDTALFMAPQGSYQVRLRVTAYLDYEMYDGDGYYLKSVPIADWEEDLPIKAAPGGNLHIKRSYSQ